MSTKKNEKNGLSKIVRVGILSLCVYMTASFFGKQENKDFVLRNLEKTGIITYDTSTTLNQVEDNDFSILDAVMNNPYLSDDEKELLYSFSDLIRENPNINNKATYNTLENLKIEYIERDSKYDETIKGIFMNETNTIQIFEPKETVQKEIVIHELIHSIFNNKEVTLLPEYLIEGVTEILVNEYFSETPYLEENTYPFEIAMTKTLCEMTSPEIVLKAYTTGNMNPIYIELSSVMGLKSTSDFLKNVNNIFKEYKENKRVCEDLLPEIFLYMDSFFKYKYEQSNDISILDRYFYSKGIIELMKEEDSYQKYWDYLLENGLLQQSYFSKNLKEQVVLSDQINIDGSPKKDHEYQYFYANESLN